MPKCYHHDMLTEATLQAWMEQKHGLEEEYPYLVNPPPDLQKSQVILSSIDELRDESNPYDIAFRPSSLQEGRAFDLFLSTEIGYRGLEPTGTIGDKRQRLLKAIESESIYNLMTRLVASTNLESAFCEVESAIPCIMHGGNHIGEKIFMMLLLEVWSNCRNKEEKELFISTALSPP
jgi:hypothetical protein